VDLAQVDGSGPGVRVTADDVRAAAEPARRPERPSEEKKGRDRRAAEREEGRPFAPEALPLPDFTKWGPVHREPLRSIRRATAERMAVAWSRIPHVTHQDLADITELERFRREHRDAAEEEDATLSLTALVLKVAVAALKQHPRFNASLDTEAGEIVYKDYYHIGVAVATERGLLVPVLRDADRKSLVEIAVELAELADRARQGDLQPEHMRGGTFTITNPGPLGGTAFTPIINWPQVAILGMAKARWEPVAEGERERPRITQRLMLPLCMAFDHRVNDGADAARFTSTIAEMLTDPASLTLGI
jgi:pyruvate dehydrogenase E2 component (dihydrolipoamide acetyltransferase)